MGVACQLDLLGHYYEIGKIVHSDTIIFKLSNLNQKSSHKLDAKGMNFKNWVRFKVDRSTVWKWTVLKVDGRAKVEGSSNFYPLDRPVWSIAVHILPFGPFNLNLMCRLLSLKTVHFRLGPKKVFYFTLVVPENQKSKPNFKYPIVYIWGYILFLVLILFGYQNFDLSFTSPIFYRRLIPLPNINIEIRYLVEYFGGICAF